MAKKPSLETLPIAARLQKKPEAERETAVAATATPVARKANPGKRDYKTIMARINFQGWRELRDLSLDTGEPMEQMIIRGLNDVLAAAGRPAIVEHRRPPKEDEE